MITTLLVLTFLMVFAAFGIVFILQEKEGPLNIIEKLRKALTIPEEILIDDKLLAKQPRWKQETNALYECGLCMGTWVVSFLWITISASAILPVFPTFLGWLTCLGAYYAAYPTLQQLAYK